MTGDFSTELHDRVCSRQVFDQRAVKQLLDTIHWAIGRPKHHNVNSNNPVVYERTRGDRSLTVGAARAMGYIFVAIDIEGTLRGGVW